MEVASQHEPRTEEVFQGGDSTVSFTFTAIPDGDERPNVFSLKLDSGSIEIKGKPEFVSTIFGQLLSHPDSLVGHELMDSYDHLPPEEQKRFRQMFKVGELEEGGR